MYYTGRLIPIAQKPLFQITLNPLGSTYFDAYRNPNTKTSVVATLTRNSKIVTDFAYEKVELRWLNADGVDVVENELYADDVSNITTLNIDKTYIDDEIIKCEAWHKSEKVAESNVRVIRKFNPYTPTIQIPALPAPPEVTTLNLSISMTDEVGSINVDSAFFIEWMVVEDTVTRKIATGAIASVPASSINMGAANLQIYPSIKRREAYAALTTIDAGEEALLTDDLGNVLTVETYS